MRQEELKDLLESLTLEEKIYQLVQLSGDFYNAGAMAVGPQAKLGISQEVVDNAGSVLNVLGAEKVRKIQKEYLEKSRHKIPLLFMADIVYGYKTIYPIPLALGCTWDPGMVKQCNEKTAVESMAAGAHVTFAPMVDLVRDPRWGRVMESTGEDAYLNSRFSKAMVEGFQGELSPTRGIASCVKHFAAYGAVEAGRDYNTVDMSERRLRQDYLPAYKAAVDAGCEMVMTSFNTVDGMPATGNKWLMKDVLRDEWGFDGVIITDYAAIQEMIAHGVAENDREAAKLSIEAGVDIDMKTPCYSNQLQPLIRDGEIDEQLVNESCMRVLQLKNKLGLFEDPYRGCSPKQEADVLLSEESRAYARKVAADSLVLLQNKDQVLPLSREKKTALIGPYGDSTAIIGLWAVHGDQKDVVTLKKAMGEKLGEKLLYAKGCEMLRDYSFLGEFGANVVEKFEEISTDPGKDLQDALAAAKEADTVVFAMGEHMMQSGEAGSRTELTLPSIQLDLLEKVRALGKKTVLVLFSGRPLILTELRTKVDAIVQAWFPGTEGGHGIADVLFGDVNPGGKLTMSFPYAVGQIPVYYNAFNTGRPVKTSTHSGRFMSKFLDCPNEPLYPFGYGLSYARYKYEDLHVSADTRSEGEVIQASVNVTNIGDVAGAETVQFYIQDVTGSVVRPVKELRGFEKVWLKPGETKTVTMDITEETLKFFTASMEYRAEKGRFFVYAGGSSRDEDLLKEAFMYV